MKDEELTFIQLNSIDDFIGCSNELINASKQAAIERKLINSNTNNINDDVYCITLSRSLIEPFLTYSKNRNLRKKAFELWTSRGELNEKRNNKIITEKILKLRYRQAILHGFPTFSHYQLADTMAGTPDKVNELLLNVWNKAKISANKERIALEECANTICKETGEELEDGIQAWDWRYYAEIVRIKKYNFNESELKPYLSLDKITEAVFAVSERLYGLKYIYRPDIISYHKDVKVYEVHENNKLKAIFLHDNYARSMKASGAWMNELRSQTKNTNSINPLDKIPIVMNNNNFAKGSPTLLSFDDAITLFHEMGHGHHGMLSDCTYNRLASTNVLTDFLELPSQLMEHWIKSPIVLKEYALHYENNSIVPDDLLKRRKDASSFNQGFDTIEYTSCALLDIAMHSLTTNEYETFDMMEFERTQLLKLGMPQGIVMRHRPCHFQHLFSGSHYASSYYVYLWAEVLDADAFAAFEESGDIFNTDVALKARQHIYSQGNMVDPVELFRRYRGRDPDIKYMLRKKGLVDADDAEE
jgi:peptidyl-dipeptidase Dcp